MALRTLVVIATCCAVNAFNLPAAHCHHRSALRTSSITANQYNPRSDRQTPQEEADAKAAVRAALEAAENKLEGLNEVGQAKSWADLGLPAKGPEEPAVPAFVSYAPLVVGGFSLTLFLLNAVGLFGDGPDLDALVEEWSQL